MNQKVCIKDKPEKARRAAPQIEMKQPFLYYK